MPGKPWSATEDHLIRTYYATWLTEKLLVLLPGRSDNAVKCRAHGLGLKKNADVRSAALKAGMRRRKTPMLAGRPIGSTHRKGRYTLIKIAQPDVWKPLHIHTWEQAHGPVPEGLQVSAKDGDPSNASLDNLCLRTLAEIQLRTHAHYRGLPEEVLDVLHLQNEIRKTIKRKRGNEKQAVGPARPSIRGAGKSG